MLGWITALLAEAGLAWLILRAQQGRFAAETAAHRATQAQLEAANAAKSRYLVAVSHEIRSPLNAIYGYAQLLERGHDIAPQEAARIIRRSSEHLANLVEGLLDISHVESGALRLSDDTLALHDFFDEIAGLFRPQAAAKGLRFVVEGMGDLPACVRIDHKRLRQIFVHLLTNAIKFTSAGEVSLRATYHAPMAHFTIADSGIGIAPADLERVFLPFERGSHPEAQRQKGIGLGLAITRALVQMLGGDLVVSSEQGSGTGISVSLPLKALPAPERAAPAPHSITGYDGPPRSILLIDDDPDQLALLRGLLEPLGFMLHGAHDGDEGLAMAQQLQPDLVLLDVTMPGLSGWEVARRLRASRGCGIRIVMVSGDAPEIQPDSADFFAHDQFLIKPVNLDALIAAIGALLGLQWQGAEAQQSRIEVPLVGQHLSPEAAPFLSEIESQLRIGHIRGIERAIHALGAAVPEAEPLVQPWLALLERCDMVGLGAVLKLARGV